MQRMRVGLLAAVVALPTMVVSATASEVTAAAPGDVVFNEILYHPADDHPDGEFVELYNRSGATVDLSGWCIDGIKYCFPGGSSIPAGGFEVVRSSAYSGSLSNGGEDLTLLDPAENVIDFVEYDDKKQWPAFADGEGFSLQRLDIDAETDNSGNWRSDVPTPSRHNEVRGTPMPVWSKVEHTVSPAPGQAVTVTAKVTGANDAAITYVVGFGAPVNFAVPIVDGKISVTIPGRAAGQLIRYRLAAASTERVVGFWPRQGDGALYTGTVVASSSTTDLPRFEWFMPDSTYNTAFGDLTLTGDDGYPAVLAYDGEIFDNTKVRVKGQVSRYQPKKKWKFILPPGHELEIDGLTPEKLDEFALHSNWTDKSFIRETLASEAFKAAGVAVSQAFPVQLERNNQFYGLYTYVEQQDGTWRDRWGLDEGSVYEVGGGRVFGLLFASDAHLSESALRRKYEKETKEFEDDAELRNLITVLNSTSGAPRRAWIYDNVDVPSVVNTLAASMAFQHQDIGHKNYRLVLNQLGKWTTIPTDFDLTFGRRGRLICGSTCDGVGIGGAFEHPGGPLFGAFFFDPELVKLVRQRLRTITEEILRDGGLHQRVVELRDLTADEAVRDRAIWGTHGYQKPPADDANDIVHRFLTPQVSRLLGTMVRQGRVASTSGPKTPRLAVTDVSYFQNGIIAPYFTLQNLEGVPVDISSYVVEELEYTVPGGTILQPGQTMVAFHEDAGAVAPMFRGRVLGGIFGEDLDDFRDGFTVKNRFGTVVTAWTKLPPRETTEITGAPNRSGIVSLTIAASAGGGYLQVVDCDDTPGKTANVNSDGAGQDRAGAAIVRFDDDGTACIYNATSTHVVVDLQGYLAAGAIDDVDDIRLVNTRKNGPLRPAGSQTKITGRPNSSAFVSIVAVETAGPGNLRVVPCGAAPGKFSNNNFDAAGQTRSSLSVVQFDEAGEACIATSTPTHIVADLQAYLVPNAVDDIVDERILDTRSGAKPVARSVITITGRPNSTGIAGVVATQTEGPGYIQVLPCGVTPGKNSNVNYERPAQDLGSMAMLPFDANGEACVYTSTATHIVVDLQAYFTPGSFEDVADVRLIDTRKD